MSARISIPRHVNCHIGWWGDIYSDDQCYVCWKHRKTGENKKDRIPEPVIICSRGTRTMALPTAVSEGRRISLPITLSSVAPCAYLGQVVTQNQTCGCHEKLRFCEIHEVCTTRSPRPGISCCETCPSYRFIEDEDADRRHLLYYVYPVSGNGLWQRNLDQLKRRINLFNGRRVIAISTGSARHPLDAPQQVEAYFGKNNADFLWVPHQKKLGEVTAFTALWNRVKNFCTPNDFTFYGHTKGVTKPVNSGISVHRWGDLMYAANLDRWNVVRDYLTRHPITGAFKKYGACFGGRGNWHYHGTFYWCRNADVFAKPNWSTVRQIYGGTELWPATMWSAHESGCHFYGGIGYTLYNVAEVARAEDMIRRTVWGNHSEVSPSFVLHLPR